ncbi:large conductance mechanosensitive channel protein MscL [Erythrobacter donghaensis]|jgi:large conductance mechanosensitive channel|uniref:large conductance mechanosensitive channel protein MscL n=1 Tax=Erythrobacter donghaensis TaxID=267135 RepID=UPI00093B3104|nr:large conductance mechanosensitive channel protein MscL [Erythrobacter donghaensis]
MLSEFKTFIARGNVLDLAVGVIIGAAFGTIVKSLTDDVIMPVIALVTGGGVDFSSRYIVLSGEAPAGASLAAARAAGANVLAYGSFVTAFINFVILAFAIFLIVRQANKLMPPPEAAPAGPSEVELLAEIRDALRK